MRAELCELQGFFKAGDGASAREGKRLELGVAFLLLLCRLFLVFLEASFKEEEIILGRS